MCKAWSKQFLIGLDFLILLSNQRTGIILLNLATKFCQGYLGEDIVFFSKHCYDSVAFDW